MSDPDNNGQDGLKLCEAWKLSGESEKLRDAVARQFNMATDKADLRIRAGYVSVNGTVETDAGCSVRLDADITVQPDPQGAEWDALREERIMSDPDNNGQDGLKLCEAHRMANGNALKRSDFVEGPEGDRGYQIERACDRLMQLLPMDALEALNSGVFPAGLAVTINSAALAELERRDALKPKGNA